MRSKTYLSVRKAMEQRGLTVAQLARRAKVDRTKLGRFLNGKRDLWLREFERVIVEVKWRCPR